MSYEVKFKYFQMFLNTLMMFDLLFMQTPLRESRIQRIAAFLLAKMEQRQTISFQC